MWNFYQVGDKLPSVELYENSPANKVNIMDLCAGKKVILFAVPGAFTPGCSKVSFISQIIFFSKKPATDRNFVFLLFLYDREFSLLIAILQIWSYNR